MADLQDTYAKILAAQSGGGNTPSAMSGMGPSTVGMDPSRFSFGDAYSFGLMNNMFNQGQMASEAVPPMAPPASSSPTGNTLGDIGLALGLFGSGLRGDMLPGIAVMQQLEQRRTQAAAIKAKKEELQQQNAMRDFADTNSVLTQLKDNPKALTEVLQQRAKAGSPTSKLYISAGVGKEDFGDIQHLLPIIQELDPEGYGMVQQALQTNTVDKLDTMRLRGMKDMAVEERKRRITVSAESRDWARLNAMEPEKMSDSDIARHQELSVKRAKMDEEREKIILSRIKTRRETELVSPTQAQPATGLSQGQQDVVMGIASPEAQQVAAQKDTQELIALMQSAGIDPQSKEGQGLLRVAAERKAKGTPLVNLDMGQDASKEAQKKFMDKASETYQQLKTAPVQLANLEKAKALIPKARGFMGPFGETKLEVAKFLNNSLGMSIDPKGINNAEELRTRIFQNILENLKKMDSQPSQYQQVIMMESLGKLGTDPNALPGVINAYADIIRERVGLYNNEVASAEQRGVKFPYDPIIKLETTPAAPKPKDIQQKFKRLGELTK